MKGCWTCAYEPAKDKVWRSSTEKYGLTRFHGEDLYRISEALCFGDNGPYFGHKWERLLSFNSHFTDIVDSEVPPMVRLTWELLQ